MRAIWIISTTPKQSLDNVQFSKKFPTVEARFRRSFKDKYTIPDEEEFAALFYNALEAYKEDASSAVPVLFANDFLSPLIFASCNAGYVVGLPFITLKQSSRTLLDNPDLGMYLNVLCEIAAYVDVLSAENVINSQFWSTFSAVLSMCMPLGTLITPLLVGENLVVSGLTKREAEDKDAMHSDSVPSAAASDGVGVMKAPSWRVLDNSVQPSKRPKVVLTVEEMIESYQYDRAYGATDTAKLSGTVHIWTDLVGTQGIAPEFSIKTLVYSNPAPSSGDHRDWMGCVGCSQSSVSADPYDSSFTCAMGAGVDAKDRVCHITITPPLKLQQTILRYHADPPNVMPFRAFYQMKLVSSKEAKLLIQIKLNDKITNNFEYCNVFIPFSSIGMVEGFEVSPTEGVVKKSNDNSAIIWELGTAITGRKLECALPMSVRFVEDIQSQSPSSSSPSCYIDLNFKILDCTIAGVKVTDELVIYPKPSTNVNVTINSIVQSGCYRIWNSLGEVRQVKKL